MVKEFDQICKTGTHCGWQTKSFQIALKGQKTISTTSDTVTKLPNKPLTTLKKVIPFYKLVVGTPASQLPQPPSPLLTSLCSWKSLFIASPEADKNLFFVSSLGGLLQVYEIIQFLIQLVISFIFLILGSGSSILNIIKIFNKRILSFHEEN